MARTNRQPAPPRGAPHERPERRRGEPGVRQCAVTRARLPRSALVRLVVGLQGEVAIDLLERAPGRGVYVRADRSSLLKALVGKGIGKTFRGRAVPMTPPQVEALADDAVQRLDNRLVELVTVARRAQVAAVGMDAVLESLSIDSPAPVVVYCHDVSDRSLRRVRAAASPPTRVVGLGVSKAELGSKLGRSDVGVVAIRPSALATRIVAEAVRRDGLGALLHARPQEEGLIRDNGEPAGGRSN